MDTTRSRDRLAGCYTTIPTMFRDDDALTVDLAAIARHVEFLIDGGRVTGDAVLLAGGAAGDFSTMTFDERVALWEAAVGAAAGPFMDLWVQTEGYIGGDGYLDKLCMELVGLPSSRNRPPTRDVRALFRDKARQMLLDRGVPNVIGAPSTVDSAAASA